MDDNDYWDEVEYNFFNTLDDVDKLMYMYDLMLGDFQDDYYGIDDDSDFEFDEFVDDDTPIRQEVTALIDKSGYLSITGASVELLNKVVTTMVMDGMILSDKKLAMSDNGEISLNYRVIGTTTPISVN
jgi:hypothetical protein|tara:strand:+ start:773 stop:1156 length:384 start_codon:yes stop_codon:yes gene_type:complete